MTGTNFVTKNSKLIKAGCVHLCEMDVNTMQPHMASDALYL